jgi:serine phosphatase RsbU (regulator of sigma subunit)
MTSESLSVGTSAPCSIRFVGGMGGAPLGITNPALVDDDFVALEPGAVLVLYTDGLVEDRHRGIDQGLGELAECLSEPDGEPGDTCERLVGRLLADRLQEDDVAVLALRRLP